MLKSNRTGSQYFFLSFPTLLGCYKISIVFQSRKQKLPGYYKSIPCKWISFYLLLWKMNDTLTGAILYICNTSLEFLNVWPSMGLETSQSPAKVFSQCLRLQETPQTQKHHCVINNMASTKLSSSMLVQPISQVTNLF